MLSGGFFNELRSYYPEIKPVFGKPDLYQFPNETYIKLEISSSGQECIYFNNGSGQNAYRFIK